MQKKMPPVRFELTTPGLRDQCSTTELKRLRIILLLESHKPFLHELTKITIKIIFEIIM